MYTLDFLVSTLSLVIANASPLAPMDVSHVGRSGIQWSPCGLSSQDQLNRTVPILCGTLAVPLDYTQANCTETTNIPLVKISAASNATKKASVITNFGGPGINGTSGMVTLGAEMHAIIGNDRDLITFHPRGTDDNLLFSCYPNATARATATSAYPPVLGNASDVADGQLWMNGKIFSDACVEAAKQNGELVGTAFTARDMMQIVDALGEDGLLRYWGFSYGTILGSTVAAMFPDRIDKLIIDGVVNAVEYYHSYELTSRQSADDALMGFCQGCLQTPDRCSLAQNRTAEQLYEWIFSLIDESKFDPIVLEIPAEEGGDVGITYTILKGLIYAFMYSPESWPELATLIEAVATRNAGPILQYIVASASAPPEEDDEAEYGIGCSDKFPRASSFAEIQPFLSTLRTSRLGGDIEDVFSTTCAQWPFAAKERYNGNFNVKTRNPMLVIGNTYDPATPLASARNVSSGFEGSVLLEQRGYGHASIAQASLCTQRAVRSYFNDGILPQPGTVCKVDEPLFPADGGESSWAYVLQQLEQTNNTGTTIS